MTSHRVEEPSRKYRSQDDGFPSSVSQARSTSCAQKSPRRTPSDVLTERNTGTERFVPYLYFQTYLEKKIKQYYKARLTLICATSCLESFESKDDLRIETTLEKAMDHQANHTISDPAYHPAGSNLYCTKSYLESCEATDDICIET